MKLDTETEWCLPNNVVGITCMDNQLEKVSKTVRLIGFLIQNGLSKSNRVMQDMQEVMKRGKNIGKTLNNVIVKHSCAVHVMQTCISFQRSAVHRVSLTVPTAVGGSYYLRRQK